MNTAAADSAKQEAARPRGGLAASALSNWLWYLLVLASGFLLPPLIDRHYGRELLGVWDLGWSLVFYIGLLTLGIGSAVNRFISRSQSTQDWDGLNAAANSALAVLLTTSAVGVLLAIGFSWMIPLTLPGLSASAREVCQQLILVLGVNAALQLPEGVFNGVITGFERFTLLNAIRGVRDVLLLAIMVLLILTQQGLVSLAWSLLICELAAFAVTVFVAHRVCPQLRIHPRHCRPEVVRGVLAFAGKTVMQELARSGVYQINAQIIASFLGPGALAIFARPRALLMHLMRFVKQYAQVFVPRSAALDATGDAAALRRLLVQSSRYGLLLALPPTIVLLTMGDWLLQIWMGPEYRVYQVTAVLALGHLFSVPQLGVYSILMGMALHGKTALFELISAACSIVLGVVLVGVLQWGLLGAAIAISLPIAITGGVLVPAYACKCVELRLSEYVRSIAPLPLLLNLPLAGVLIGIRLGTTLAPGVQLLLGLAIGGVLTTLLYYLWALPESLRRRIAARLGFSRSAQPRTVDA